MKSKLPELYGSNAPIIVLTGIPYTETATAFHELTGLHPSPKACTIGITICGDEPATLINLPEADVLSLCPVAQIFPCFSTPDCIIVVCDALHVERGICRILQAAEVTPRVLLCIHNTDAHQKYNGVLILEQIFHIPTVEIVGSHRNTWLPLKEKINQLLRQTQLLKPPLPTLPESIAVYAEQVAAILPEWNPMPRRWTALHLLGFNHAQDVFLTAKVPKLQEILQTAWKHQSPEEFSDCFLAAQITESEVIAATVIPQTMEHQTKTRRLDQIFIGKWGFPITCFLLGLLLWITIAGASRLSVWMSHEFFWLGNGLSHLLMLLHTPDWLHSFLINGIYTILALVLSVMLPPAVIFFPLLTLLEDMGYLPRAAFNLDHYFQRANTCGEQYLSMCTGFCCNAAGVTACRTIYSPRERLTAILTNALLPCSGKLPAMFACITLFFSSNDISTMLSSKAILLGLILLGIFTTFGVSRILSATILHHMPSVFTLELPPYRRPRISCKLLHSILARILSTVGNACLWTLPAGVLLWILTNGSIDSNSLLSLCTRTLETPGQWLGMDGSLLLAFLMGFFANEIMLPVALMIYTSGTVLSDINSFIPLHEILTEHGWTWSTALCVLLFQLFHCPCAATCHAIYRETQSRTLTLTAMGIPTLLGILCCGTIALLERLLCG